MAYYTPEELNELGFKYVGNNVKISDKSSIYNHNQISIGDDSRIDDFCVVSGLISIGKHIHITPQCLIAGGEQGIILEDYTTLAYGVKIFSQSDDYSGKTMANSTIPVKYKNEYKKTTILKKYTIVGAGSCIMPGVTLNTGTSVGAMSLVIEDTDEWSIYAGVPVKKIKQRSKQLLKLSQQFEDE